MTASLPSDSGPALAPLGIIEPHALLLTQPASDQRLFKIMKAEHLIQSIEGGYLHFNRVDAYSDFPLADAHDGAELPLDQPANQAASFEKSPGFTPVGLLCPVPGSDLRLLLLAREFAVHMGALRSRQRDGPGRPGVRS